MWDKVLVTLQLLLLSVLFLAPSLDKYFGGPHFSVPFHGSLQIVAVGGITVAFVFLILGGALRLGKYARVHPEPMKNAPLQTTGAYRFSRHPMYSGILLGAFFWTLFLTSYLALACSILLTLILSLKARREEQYLKNIHGKAYTEYMKIVGRFAPFIC